MRDQVMSQLGHLVILVTTTSTRQVLVLQVLPGRFVIIGFGAHCEMILDIGFADDRAGDQALSSQHRAVPGDTL
jgi:hypothetical protein